MNIVFRKTYSPIALDKNQLRCYNARQSMNKSVIAFCASLLFLTNAGLSQAAGSGYGQSNCQVIYGGGQVCANKIQFTIDKKVLTPTKGGTFVDNLGMNDVKFQPSQQVTFKITVKNTGDKKIDRLDVKDTLPSYITFVSGVGTYDKNTNVLSYTIANLEKDATNEQSFVGTIAGSDKLPQNQSVICLTNAAQATDNNGIMAKDTAGLCVEKGIIVKKPTPPVYESVPVKKIPETGPEALSLIALIPAGLAGFALRKKSKLN